MNRPYVLLLAVLGAVASCSSGPASGEDRERAAADTAVDVRDQTRAGIAPQEERPEFSADSAFALLERQVGFGPRVPGTAGHAAQLEWMRDYLRDRADTLWSMPFQHEFPDGTETLTNLFAQFQPRMRDRLLFVAHWDTRPTADMELDPDLRLQPILGANDGASGTAVLLQLADVLSRHSPPIGVDLLLVDGEDYAPNHMYLGARQFAASLPPGYEPLYGVVVDMVGDGEPRYPQEGYSRQYAPEVVDRVWAVAEQLGYQDYFVRVPGIAVTDDHVPLNQAGIRTIDIIDFDFGPGNSYWHTSADNLEHVTPEGLGVVGSVLVALVWRGG